MKQCTGTQFSWGPITRAGIAAMPTAQAQSNVESATFCYGLSHLRLRFGNLHGAIVICDMWPGTCFGHHACCTSLYRCEAVSQQPWPSSPVGHAYIQPLPKCAAQAVYMPNRLIECLYHTHIVSHSPAADSISHTSLSSLLGNMQIVNMYTRCC